MRLEVINEILLQEGARIWRISRVGERGVDGYVVERWVPFKVWRHYETARHAIDLIRSYGPITHRELVENPSLHGWREKVQDRESSVKPRTIGLERSSKPRQYFPRSSREREIYSLLSRAKSGDEKASQRILELYLGVVKWIVKEKLNFDPGSASLVSQEDLVQDGLEAVLRAIRDFDTSNGLGFEQYLQTLVRYRIIDQLREKTRSVRIPRNISRSRRVLNRAREQLERQGNYAPSLEEVALQAGMTIDQARTILEAPVVIVSLNQPVELEEDSSELGEIWEEQAARDPRNWAVETDNLGEVEASQLQEAVKKLSERERLVLYLRFFTDPPYAQKRIGEALGVTESRVSQIQAIALEKIRKELTAPDSAKIEPPVPLSPRQAEVATLLERGFSGREIAGSLGIDHETVKAHIKKVYRKRGKVGRRGGFLPNELRKVLVTLGLTPREIDVAEGLLEGKSIRENGRELFVSYFTVQNHRKNIYRRLGVHSRKQFLDLVEEAYRNRNL